jgi:antitoxin MazE
VHGVIRKWSKSGDSGALQLPNEVLQRAGLQLAQKVEVVVSRNQIVIRPAGELEYGLQALVDGIRPQNSHDPMDFGSPRGREFS